MATDTKSTDEKTAFTDSEAAVEEAVDASPVLSALSDAIRRVENGTFRFLDGDLRLAESGDKAAVELVAVLDQMGFVLTPKVI